VQADAHTNLAPARPRVFSQTPLRGDGGGDRIAGAGEREEERVALGIDLGSSGGAERLAEDPSVVARQLAVRLVAKLLEQPRRAFDVGEREGHRAGVQLAHGATVVEARTALTTARTVTPRA
jgi:hypothetical protein